MPVPKRYFHVSQEINQDPELWVFTEVFGDRSLRTWLQILAFLDRSENRWRLTEGSFENLSRMVRQQSKTVRRQVEEMIKKSWLVVLEADSDGSPVILGARNWAKYNRRQERKGNTSVPEQGSAKERIETPSVPTPTPFLPVPTPEEFKKEIGLVVIKPADVLPNVSTPKKVVNRGSAISEDFVFNERAEAMAQGYGLNPHKELAAFRDYHTANGTISKDWQASFRMWLRNAVKFAAKGVR